MNGLLYGTTYYGGKFRHGKVFGHGTVFSVSTTGTEQVLHNFNLPRDGRDGSQTIASLIKMGGTLYGTTQYGGAYGQGTVFSISTSGKFHVLHSFNWRSSDGAQPEASLINVGGTLYGTTRAGGSYGDGYGCCGTVFSITPGGTEKVLHSFGSGSDALGPFASLINVNGTLYGTTFWGGACTSKSAFGEGTVFSISTSGAEKVLLRFGCPPDSLELGAGA